MPDHQNRISLLIPLSQKDWAKEIQTIDPKTAEVPGEDPNSTHILWDNEKEEWYWPNRSEASLPPKLIQFVPTGSGPVQDTVLNLSIQTYRKILPTLTENKAGRLRWNLSLQRAIWRGKKDPGPPLLLQKYLPKPRSEEAIATWIINRIPQPQSRKKWGSLQITSQPWDQKPRDNELVLTTETPEGFLSPENTDWLFPATEETKFKKPYQGRIPTIRIPQTPEFTYRSKEGRRLTQLCRLAPNTIIHLPAGLETDPRATFHCLPELERKYRRSLKIEDFPKVLQSFDLAIRLEKFQLEWTPTPEKDTRYLKTLLP